MPRIKQNAKSELSSVLFFTIHFLRQHLYENFNKVRNLHLLKVPRVRTTRETKAILLPALSLVLIKEDHFFMPAIMEQRHVFIEFLLQMKRLAVTLNDLVTQRISTSESP